MTQVKSDPDFPTPPTYSQTITNSGNWITVVTKTHYPDGSVSQQIKTISKQLRVEFLSKSMESKLDSAYHLAVNLITDTEQDIAEHDPDEKLISTFYQLDRRVAKLQINYEVFKQTKGIKNND